MKRKKKRLAREYGRTRYAALVRAMKMDCPHVSTLRRVMKAAILEAESHDPKLAMIKSAQCANMQDLPEEELVFHDVNFDKKIKKAVKAITHDVSSDSDNTK